MYLLNIKVLGLVDEVDEEIVLLHFYSYNFFIYFYKLFQYHHRLWLSSWDWLMKSTRKLYCYISIISSSTSTNCSNIIMDPTLGLVDEVEGEIVMLHLYYFFF